MDGDEKSRWPVIAGVVVLVALMAIGWYATKRSAARDAAVREAAAAQGGGDRSNTDWNKVEKDAARIEEKSRQRAERQRQQLLDKTKKE